MTKIPYLPIAVSPAVRYYASPGVVRAPRLTAEAYAEAREAIGAWCLDGLVCGVDERGAHAVVLAVRRDGAASDGPFRGEPWVIGGRWDLVTPWEEFVVVKARAELFGGRDVAMRAWGPIGHQLFATGWGRDADGPFGRQGVTLQYCYQLTLDAPIDPATPAPDGAHASCRILGPADDLSALHPYIRDVIQMSRWLAP